MFRLPSNDGSNGDSDDSISITSTVFSEDDPDNTYIVENILAERYFSDEERTKYLVKWEGYPIDRASWEPIEMFDDKNTINEWKAMKQRQESGNSSPQFDWQKWDADREKELHDQQVRKMRRMKKRQKLQKAMGKPASSRGSRASSAKIKNFVVSDDETMVSPEEESESDVQRSRRRRRKKAEEKESEELEEEDSGNTSADSLMQSLAKKAQRKRGREWSKRDTNAPESKKQKVKIRGRQSVEDSEDEDSQGENFYVEEQMSRKKPPNVTQNGKSTKPNRKSTNQSVELEKNVAVTTSKLSRMDMHQRKPSIGSTTTPKASTNITKSGPRRRAPSNSSKASDPAVLPGVPRVGKFISLSQANRVYKRGRNEPAPDINALELFHANDPKPNVALGRRVSGSGIPTATQPPEAKNLPDDVQRHKETTQPTEKTNPPTPQGTEEFRGPKRRKTEEGLKVHTLSLDRYQATHAKRNQAQSVSEVSHEAKLPELEDQSSLGGEDGDMGVGVSEDIPLQSTGPLVGDKVREPWALKKPKIPTGPAVWQFSKMEVDIPESPGIPEPPVKPTFECELEMGTTNIESIGVVKFTGFSSAFTSFVDRLQIDCFWVSRFLEDAYISNFLVPELGVPLEFADMEVDRDKSQSFINALVVSHGAGVVLHEEFTLLVFQPSNDKLRQAFKTPMQQTRTPLRAVAYPPFDVPTPSRESPQDIAIQTALKEQPMNGYYIHTLLDRMLGVNCAEILQNSKGVDNFIIYCPEIAQGEHDEMEMALKVLGGSCWPVERIPELYEKHGLKMRVNVLVHFSLKRQLHLLPYVRYLKSRDQPFYFFGTRLEQTLTSGAIQTRLIRFWNFGTLILLTPKFVMANEQATQHVLNYQRAKAASTTICFSRTMLAQAEAYVAKRPNEPETSLKSVYALIDKKKRGEAVELPVQEADGFDELETIADAFALHQLEHCTDYRRFMIGHSKDEDISTAKAGLYNCIEFHDPDSLINELMLRAPGKPPPKKQRSEG